MGQRLDPVSVAFSTGDGTAQSGVDYTAVSGTLSWTDGDASPKTIAVPIINRTDTLDDYDRSFTVSLSNPTGGAVLGPARMSIVGLIGFTTKTPPPQTDSDGDGVDDASEYLAGTDPRNRLSVLKITDAAWRDTPHTVDLSWETVGGRYYSVYKSTNLLQGSPASPLTTAIAGNGSTVIFSDPAATNDQAFYRIRADVQP